MTPEQEFGRPVDGEVLDDIVDEHIAQGSLVRAFRTMAEKVEVALSAGVPARSPRVLGAFFASMAAWQLAYLRSRGATARTTATSSTTPLALPPAAVITSNDSVSGAPPAPLDSSDDLTPTACSPDIPDTISPLANTDHRAEVWGTAYSALYREGFGQYVAARADECDVNGVDGELIDRAYGRKYNTRADGKDRIPHWVAGGRLTPQSSRQRRELAMV